VQPPKQRPYALPFNYNPKHASSRDLHQAERTDSNTENVHPYSNAQQASQSDPYHVDSADWSKGSSNNEFHPYYDCDATVLPNQYDSFLSPKLGEDDKIISSLNVSLHGDNFVSSLDVHLQLDFFSRARNNQAAHHNKGFCNQFDANLLSDSSSEKSDRILPVPFTPPKETNPPYFSVENSGKFSGFAFKEHVTPERRKITEKELGLSSLNVEYNERGSPYKAFIQDGDEFVELLPSMKTEDFYTFASLNKSRPRDIYNPLHKSTLKPSFAEFTRFSGSVVVTQKEIGYWAGKRKNYKPTQRQSMGNLKATDLAKAAGVEVTGQYHHTHLIRFGFTPINGKPNDDQNIIVATAGANFQHLMLEDTAKALVTQHGSVVITFDIPRDQEVFDPVFHLFGFVNYKIYEAKIGEDEIKGALLQSFKIDALNPNLPHTEDQKYIQAYAYASKLRARDFKSTDDYKRISTPNDDNPQARKRLKSEGHLSVVPFLLNG